MFSGSLHELFSTRVRWWPIIVVAFAVELVLFNPPVNAQTWAIQLGPWIWLATKLALLAALLRNAVPAAGTVGWPWLIAAAGVALNALVIALNGGHMPQAPEAAIAVWGASHIDPITLQNVAPMRPETVLPWLADVLPQPAWLPRRNVVSVGDILLAGGVAAWAFGAMAPTISVRKGYIGLSGATQRATPGNRRCST
jgi:endonuclease/exonuclease/phosphatase (EEP) superfamily protein YafD